MNLLYLTPCSRITALCLTAVVTLLTCQVSAVESTPRAPALAQHSDWHAVLPRPIYPDAQLIALYDATWELAYGRIRTAPPGTPASPYLDENCYDDQIWIWDTCFMALFAKYAPGVFPIRESLTNLYEPILDRRPTALRIHLRDNPPLFAWMEAELFAFTANTQRVQNVLLEHRYLQRHYIYFATIPQGDLQLDVSPQKIFRRAYPDGYSWTGGASGMDNTPRGRGIGQANILWVDAISQQALSALYIARLLRSLGHADEAATWQTTYDQLKEKINALYWDETDGFYYDIAITNHLPCKVKTPASLWPLLAEVASPQQAARVVQHVEREFNDPVFCAWPTLAPSDPDFNGATGDYWRGGVWLPMVYMGTKALEKYGYTALADAMALRVLMRQLRAYHAITPHTIWECYSPSTDAPSTEYGRRARPDFCGWSALGPIALFIENTIGIKQLDATTQTITWYVNPAKGRHGLTNLSLGRNTVDLVYEPEQRAICVTSTQPVTVKCVSAQPISIRYTLKPAR